ncbi:hypothetical protein PALB_25420 [Pseudoalteromonas luteoviolacea B = ATCC 29581]|nr:hypothetical protein PALB_25420 [Pseudoalteromonas luteoviolacea B = ATCC 29581]
MYEYLNSAWQSLVTLPGFFFDANKRIYLPYLLSAIVLAIPVYWRLSRRRSAKGFLRYLFPKTIWLHESAKQDYWLFIVNRVVKTLAFTGMVLTMVPIALAVTNSLEWIFNGPLHLTWHKIAVVGIFTLMLFVFDDFTRFVLHYALHKVPFLWEFHKVHHSAKVLTPFTIYRSHPVENYLYACRMAIVQGTVVGIGYFLFGTSLTMYDVLGANAFVFTFNFLGSNLRHSHVWLSWGNRIEGVFISPAQHQIHHSNDPVHFDTNLGSALAIWDRWAGTLIKASEVGKIQFGVGQYDAGHDSLWAIYSKPFIEAIKTLKPKKTL